MCLQIGQGDEHELVKAVESNAFFFNGVWIHANFLAKPIGASSSDVPNYFFAELKSDYNGFYCLSCVKMDPGVQFIQAFISLVYMLCIYLYLECMVLFPSLYSCVTIKQKRNLVNLIVAK